MRYSEEMIQKSLPINKEQELQKITSTILQEGKDIEMIILYGSYARGKYKEEKDIDYSDPKSGRVSDYDILVVTKSKKIATDRLLWHQVEQKCNNSEPSAPVRLLAHDIHDINDKLEIGQYFYKDVKKEGKILFNSQKFELAYEKPINKERRLEIIKDYYQEFFEDVSKGFYRGYKFYYDEQDYKRAAYMLYKATESSYQITLFIFTNYIPREHYLCILADMAAKIDPRLRAVFPKESDDNYKHFEMLDYAYIGSCYDPKFKVSKKELEYIAPLVKKLLEITEEICLKEINSLENI